MNSSTVQEAMSAIRACALIMLENASYVQRELPNVDIANPLSLQTTEVCEAMISTKHDVISELFEIGELLESKAEPATISSRFNRIIKWLWEDISSLHEVLMALRADSQENKDHTLALILVEESAANILNAFNWAKAAVDAAASESNKKRNV